MPFYYFVLGVLAVWRVTHLLHAEAGPWDIFARLRRRLGTGFMGALFGCFYCLSVWIAAPLAYAVGETWKEILLLWPAFSAGAILLERAAARNEAPPAVQFWEEENVTENNEEGHHVLWKEQDDHSHPGERQV